MQVDPANIDVIAPNLKRRYSGVTSTVIRLVPVQAHQIAIATTGPVLPDNVPQFPLSKLLFLSRSGPSGARIWHSRRNIEMLVGLLLKWVLRKKFKFVFTSAAQRRRSGYSRWLIRKMDAVIAASGKANSYLEKPARKMVVHPRRGGHLVRRGRSDLCDRGLVPAFVFRHCGALGLKSCSLVAILRPLAGLPASGAGLFSCRWLKVGFSTEYPHFCL